MATVILRPDGNISNNWSYSAGSNAASLISDDSTGTYLYSSTAGHSVHVYLLDLDFTGLNIDTIDSIQGSFYADNDARAQTSVLNCQLHTDDNPSGTSIEENISVISTGGATYNMTSLTTSDGSTAWTDGDIDDMTIKIDLKTAPSTGNCILSDFWVTVTYTEAVVSGPTYTSDDNLIIKNGQIELKNGMIEIKGP